jgi:hypothetical protein
VFRPGVIGQFALQAIPQGPDGANSTVVKVNSLLAIATSEFERGTLPLLLDRPTALAGIGSMADPTTIWLLRLAGHRGLLRAGSYGSADAICQVVDPLPSSPPDSTRRRQTPGRGG